MPRGNLIQVRRGTTAQWAAADAASAGDPERLLAAGEPGRDTDTGVLKIGDGETKFADLPGYLDESGLAATYARRGLTLFAGLKRTLDTAVASTGVQVLGDSTGNEAFEWPRLLINDLAAAHPAYTVQQLLWSDATQDFVRTVLQTGTAGVQYYDGTGAANSDRFTQSASLTGTIDVRAKVRAPDYTPAASKMVAGAMSVGKRSWALCMNTAGALQFVYSTDGSAVATMSSTAALSTADNADVWLRGVLTPNDGAGNRVAKFYTSANGETWTQLGTTVTTAGAVTLFDPGTTDVFRLGGTTVGSYGYWNGRIYEVQIRNGEGGGTVAPCTPDQWYSAGSSAPVVGAPILTLVNGSHAGAGLTYLNEATRLPKMTPHYGQSLIFLSDSHNESGRTGPIFLTQYDAWVNAIKARHILPIVVLTQNPQKPTASASAPHSVRRGDLLAYAPGNGLGVIDTFAAFAANPDWATEWMGDDVHPNAAGQDEWYAAIKTEYESI